MNANIIICSVRQHQFEQTFYIYGQSRFFYEIYIHTSIMFQKPHLKNIFRTKKCLMIRLILISNTVGSSPSKQIFGVIWCPFPKYKVENTNLFMNTMLPTLFHPHGTTKLHPQKTVFRPSLNEKANISYMIHLGLPGMDVENVRSR